MSIVHLSCTKVAKTVHTAVCPCVLPYIKVIIMLEGMYTPGAQVLKLVHPAAKICTQGAGCILNFEH